MLDCVAWGEYFLLVLISLVIVPPKDWPKVLYWVGRLIMLSKKILALFYQEMTQIPLWEALEREKSISQEKEILRDP